MRPGDRFLDRFQIERLAGEGGMGTVWRAIDLSTGQPVAIKLLVRQAADPARRFALEAEVLRDLAHPGIVRHVGHGIDPEGRLWLAMEWLEGEDLEQRIARERLPLAAALSLVQRVAAIVGVAHARGVVHRDLKPRNLFLPGGELDAVKVLDFGIARYVGTALTATGLIVGTPEYMAPEQARADRRLDARVDVWALGCVLYECVTGRTPFEGEQIMAILAKILLDDPPRLSTLVPGVPPAIDDLVVRMLAKDVAARPADGATLAAELARAEAQSDESAGTPARVAEALGDDEQRLVSVVLLAAPATDGLARTITGVEAADAAAALSAGADPYGGRLERLADGSAVVALAGAGAATDQARRAARCALALWTARPEAPLALATGLADVSGRFPVGDVIDRAARLALGVGPGVWLDDVTRGLLDARFTVLEDAGGHARLVAEEEADDGERAVLGRHVPLVGRDREIALLEELFGECAEEPMARAVLVTAPAGGGKTRLRQELVARLVAGRPLRAWVGRGDPMSAGSPFALLADALRAPLGLRDGEPAAIARFRLRARVERTMPASERERVLTFLGELVDVPMASDEDEALRAAREDAILMGDQMRRAWEDFLAAECAEAPVLLVLEDLHWGDMPTVGFVDAALRNLADHPFMVLALARPEVTELFPRLWEDRRLQTLRLEGLTRRASEKLVRSLFGEDPAPERLAEIVERGAGNPFFLEELVRAARTTPGATAPATVLAMLHARLDALPADARRVLRAASVFGQVAWRGGVDSLLGGQLGRRDVELALGALVTGELLARRGETRFPGEESWSFRHALVRDAAYESLTPADRSTGHRLAAAWLERAGERDPLVLAEHHERGGEGARAVEWYRRAAEDALGGNGFALALRCVERGISCGAAGEALGRLRLLEGQARWWSGQAAAAEEASLAAAGLLASHGVEWLSALGDAAVAAGSAGHTGVVVAQATELLGAEVAPAARDAFRAAAARTTAQLVHVARLDLADALLERVAGLEAAGHRASPAVEAREHFARALRRRTAGDLPGYLDLCVVAARSASAAGDVRYAAVQNVNAGFSLLELGGNEEAEELLSAALRDAQRTGVPITAAGARSNLGVALARLGRHAEAVVLQSRAVEELERLGNRRAEGAARCYLAAAQLQIGALGAALEQARAAVAGLESYPLLRPLSLSTLARAVAAEGEVAQARGLAVEARRRLEEVGDAAQAEPFVRLTELELLLESGDRDGARALVRVAAARIQARAEAIQDPARRRQFLEGVPDNARTLERARELLAPDGGADVR